MRLALSMSANLGKQNFMSLVEHNGPSCLVGSSGVLVPGVVLNLNGHSPASVLLPALMHLTLWSQPQKHQHHQEAYWK